MGRYLPAEPARAAAQLPGGPSPTAAASRASHGCNRAATLGERFPSARLPTSPPRARGPRFRRARPVQGP
eukprot:6060894-Alexandrium_andersonii.AAC.1